MLVDDSKSDLHLYARSLTQAGYRTLTALIGSAGVSFPEHESPALILMDYRFHSSLSPQELAKLLREHYPSALLILLSGIEDLPADMGGLTDGFMRKPAPDKAAELVDLWLSFRQQAS